MVIGVPRCERLDHVPLRRRVSHATCSEWLSELDRITCEARQRGAVVGGHTGWCVRRQVSGEHGDGGGAAVIASEKESWTHDWQTFLPFSPSSAWLPEDSEERSLLHSMIDATTYKEDLRQGRVACAVSPNESAAHVCLPMYHPPTCGREGSALARSPRPA